MSGIREIEVSQITEAVKDMCIAANYGLSEDMQESLKKAASQETSPLGTQILAQLEENLEIARTEQIPICQDTGMAIVFLEIGQIGRAHV